MDNKDTLTEIQELLMKQMRRLDEAVAKEINVEVNRSGAMSQNAQAYLKATSLKLRVKEMACKNTKLEKQILMEAGVIEE